MDSYRVKIIKNTNTFGGRLTTIEFPKSCTKDPVKHGFVLEVDSSGVTYAVFN